MFHRAAPIGIVAVGMTFVVISGNYLDLSVVAQVATGAVILIGVSNSYGIPLAVARRVRSSRWLYGLVNGVAVGYFKANAVIVTLVHHLHRSRRPALAVRRQHLLRPRRTGRSTASATSSSVRCRCRRSCCW